MGRDANPITWPYLRTASPAPIAAIAILWPRGTRSRAVAPATVLPGAIASTATTTLSSGASRMVRAVVIKGLAAHLVGNCGGWRDTPSGGFILPAASATHGSG